MNEDPTHDIPRIIAVDDDHEILTLIGMLLRRLGAQAQTFYDGREALNYLTKETPDLVILDLMLPDIDGFEILSRIRSDARFDHVPVLILSAKADSDSIRRGLENGADSYVTKPYIANTLIDRVRLLLQAGRQPKPSPESPSVFPES